MTDRAQHSHHGTDSPGQSAPAMTRAAKVQLFFARTLQAVLAGELVAGLIAANWWVAFITFLALGSSFLPAILDRNTRVHAPPGFQLVITLFIFAAFLGETADFYWRFWWWDTALHIASGLVVGMVGFLVLFTLFDTDRVKMHPIMLSTLAVALAMAVGSVWEIFEFVVDKTFDLNMQRDTLSDTSGLTDTMTDEIVNAFGALISVTVAHLRMSRRRGRRWLKELGAQFVEPPAPPPPKPRRKRYRRPVQANSMGGDA